MFKDNIFIEQSEKLLNSSELTESKEVSKGIKINEIIVDRELSKKVGRNKGKYITITYNKEEMNSKKIEELISLLTTSLKNMLEELKISKKNKILFIGLGNKDITSDSFGYLVIEKISAGNKIYKMYKNVEGLTNIKSVEFTKMLAEMLEVDLVVVFDSLKAEHISRLGSTIQISNAGLYPGSAVSDKKCELSKKTVKAEVICIGVPTTINLSQIKEGNPELLVSTKDIDISVDDISSIISIAINRLF